MGPGYSKDAGSRAGPIHDQSPPHQRPAGGAETSGRAGTAMADKSPRHATVKKPSKTIKQERAAKKLKLEQATRRDVAAAIRDGEPKQTGRPQPQPGRHRRGTAVRVERQRLGGVGGDELFEAARRVDEQAMRPGRTVSSARCRRPRVAATRREERHRSKSSTPVGRSAWVADRDDRSRWRQPAGMERRIVAASPRARSRRTGRRLVAAVSWCSGRTTVTEGVEPPAVRAGCSPLDALEQRVLRRRGRHDL